MRKKRCRMWTVFLVCVCMITLAGCQETPEESAVASKAGGLSEDVLAEPLSEGETQTIELPDRWEETKKWSNDRWIFQADVDLGSIETGNLPIVEFEQHAMTQEELESLTNYFAGGETLYAPLVTTKDAYQNKLDRIRNMEGIYAVYTIDTAVSTKMEMLEKGLEAAPEAAGQETQEVQPVFSARLDDPGEDAARDRRKYISEEEDTMELYFSAEIGEDRQSSITARKYDSRTGRSSQFEWKSGDEIVYQKEDIDYYREWHKEYKDVSETDRQWEKLLDQCSAMMKDENIDPNEGRKQAETLLQELGIEDKVYVDEEPVLWFPKGTYPKDVASTYQDSLWQADLTQAETGYVYTFVNEINGQSVDLLAGGNFFGFSEDSGTEVYTSPFPVETIKVAVTQSGVKMFSWDGMCSEVSVEAENVRLLPFDELQEKITQQISYYFPVSQPADDKTIFEYELESIRFGYSYVTAYENPDHAWAVPAWFLELKSGNSNPELSASDEVEKLAWVYLTFNALDGSVIES